jgi:hypothetical protein
VVLLEHGTYSYNDPSSVGFQRISEPAGKATLAAFTVKDPEG